ncbi:MAG: DUF2812 domain-containing protein [Tissierellia bacterium]|nr:DUF2812 domain-containing protein [Tissierellia bacterium]
MLRIRLFANPIEKVEPYLNRMAAKGYRLQSIWSCFYMFEKTEKTYRYMTQYVGTIANNTWKEYIAFLKEGGYRIFHAPLNQGNIVFGKIKVRPFAHGSGTIATTPGRYNKEILVVEYEGDKPRSLLTNKEDLSRQYASIRNTYLYGTVLMMVLLGLWIRKMVSDTPSPWNYLLGLPLLVVTLFFGWMAIQSWRSEKKYKEMALLEE